MDMIKNPEFIKKNKWKGSLKNKKKKTSKMHYEKNSNPLTKPKKSTKRIVCFRKKREERILVSSYTVETHLEKFVVVIV